MAVSEFGRGGKGGELTFTDDDAPLFRVVLTGKDSPYKKNTVFIKLAYNKKDNRHTHHFNSLTSSGASAPEPADCD